MSHIYKHFNITCDEKAQKFDDNEEEDIKFEKQYFYLDNNMFGMFDGNFLFIIEVNILSL